jgi:hypothetical protein
MQKHLACNAKCKLGETKEVEKDDIPVAVACWVAITAIGTRNARFMLFFFLLLKVNLRRGIQSVDHGVVNNEGYPRKHPKPRLDALNRLPAFVKASSARQH